MKSSKPLQAPTTSDWGRLARFAVDPLGVDNFPSAVLARLLAAGALVYVEEAPRSSPAEIVAANREILRQVKGAVAAIAVERPDASVVHNLLHRLSTPEPVRRRNLRVSDAGWARLRDLGVTRPEAVANGGAR